MRAQYRQMGAMIDWSREVVTCTPEFYQWNQWIFLQMLKRGLAYRANGSWIGSGLVRGCEELSRSN